MGSVRSFEIVVEGPDTEELFKWLDSVLEKVFPWEGKVVVLEVDQHVQVPDHAWRNRSVPLFLIAKGELPEDDKSYHDLQWLHESLNCERVGRWWEVLSWRLLPFYRLSFQEAPLSTVAIGVTSIPRLA